MRRPEGDITNRPQNNLSFFQISSLRKKLFALLGGLVLTGSGALLEDRLHILGKVRATMSLLSSSEDAPEETIANTDEECTASPLEIKRIEDKEPLERSRAEGILTAGLKSKGIHNPEQWVTWVLDAMQKEKYPYTISKIAAVLAFIEQESGFQTDPKTYGITTKLREEEAEVKTSYPWINPLINGTQLEAFIKRYEEKTKGVKTEGDAVKVLHEAVREFKTQYPEVVKEIEHEDPDWELKVLESVGTLGPTQFSVLFTFTEEERRTLSAETYAQRQEEMVSDPGLSIVHTVRRLREGSLVNGTNFLQTVGDYKGGRDAHFKAKVQMALRLVNPDLTIDGDLLRYDHRGLPLNQDSQSLMAALEFNTKYELGFSREEIFKAFSKTGEALTEDCVIRSIIETALEQEGFTQEVTLDTKKGGNDRKGQETVSQYVRSVSARYSNWRATLSDIKGTEDVMKEVTEEKPIAETSQKTPKESPKEPSKKTPKEATPLPRESKGSAPTKPEEATAETKVLPYDTRKKSVFSLVKALEATLEAQGACKDILKIDVLYFDVQEDPAVHMKFFNNPIQLDTYAQVMSDGKISLVMTQINYETNERKELSRGYLDSMNTLKVKLTTWLGEYCAKVNATESAQ